jgi:hypothetical protein
VGQSAQTQSCGVEVEHPAHDVGLKLVNDEAGAAFLSYGLIAVRPPSPAESALDLAAQPPPRVGPQLHEVLLVHHTEHLGADVEDVETRARLVRGAVGLFQLVADVGDVTGVAREPREVEAQENVPSVPLEQRHELHAVLQRGA